MSKIRTKGFEREIYYTLFDFSLIVRATRSGDGLPLLPLPRSLKKKHKQMIIKFKKNNCIKKRQFHQITLRHRHLILRLVLNEFKRIN